MAYTLADLHSAELQIMQAQRDIVRQRELIEQLKGDGRSARAGRALLLTLDATLITLQQHRDTIAEALDRQ